MKVSELRRKLEKALNVLEDYDDTDEVKVVSNTYFLGNDCRVFLGLSGYDGGYINLDDPVDEEYYDEDDYDEEEDEDGDY